MALISFQRPDKIIMSAYNDREASFELAPLEPGYGITVGNTLRRVLLSALNGFAITAFRIHGVSHEFTTIPGVLEDISEIVLNLKQVRLKLKDASKSEELTADKVSFSVKEKEKFKAADLSEVLENFDILNPELVICNMDLDAKVSMDWDLYIEKGRGYVPSELNQKEGFPLGTIWIDSIYTPIVNVKYEIQNYRVEQKTDYEKLKIEIITDGSIQPKEALKEAATVFMQHVGLFVDEKIAFESPQTENEVLDESTLHIRTLLKTKLSTMNLSVRALNCLKAAEVETLGDLVAFYKSDLLKFRNFGRKSLTELEDLVKEKGLSFGMDVAKYKLDKD